MAEDVVFLMPGQPPMRGRSAFAAGQAALRQFRIEATSDIQEIKVFGDWDTAGTNSQ
jgi:ketosteroid isomerase-like protein